MRLNAIDLYGPAGSTTYQRRGDGTPYAQYTNLTPESQNIFSGQQQVAQNLTDIANVKTQQVPTDQFTLAGLPYDPSTVNTGQFGQQFNPISYSRNNWQNQPMWGGGQQAGQPAQYGGGKGGAYGGQQQMPYAPQTGMSTRSGGINPEYAKIRGENQIGQTKWDTAGRGIDAQIEAANRKYQSDVDRQRYGHYLSRRKVLDYDPTKKGGGGARGAQTTAGMSGKGGAVGGTQQVKRPNNTARWRKEMGDQWEIKNVRPEVGGGGKTRYVVRYRKAGDFTPQGAADYGNAPEAFNLDYYNQQAGTNFTDANEAWKDYATRGRKENIAYREGFQAQELPDEYLAGPSSNLLVPGGPSPVQTPTGQGPYTPQQSLPPAGGGNPAATSGFATQAAMQAPQQAGFSVQGGPQWNPGSVASGGSSYPGPVPGQIDFGPYPTNNVNAMPYDPRSYGDLKMFDREAGNAYQRELMRNAKPEMDAQYRRQQQDLINRGIPPGSEAYEKAMSDQNRQFGNRIQGIANQSAMAAGAEADRRRAAEQMLRGTSWGEAMQLYGLNNQANMQQLGVQQQLRQQALQERLLGRQQAIAEAQAAMGAAPQMPMPQAPKMPTYQLQPVDIAGIYANYDNSRMAAYQAQAQQAASKSAGFGSAISGLASLATKGA